MAVPTRVSTATVAPTSNPILQAMRWGMKGAVNSAAPRVPVPTTLVKSHGMADTVVPPSAPISQKGPRGVGIAPRGAPDTALRESSPTLRL